MSKPWEPKDYAEMEARLRAARELRREMLGGWVAEAARWVLHALASLGHRQHPAHTHHAA